MTRTTAGRVACALFVCLFVLPLRAQAQRPVAPVPTAVWATKPTRTPAYTPPQKRWIKLSDCFHPDTREWFAVVEGEVTIDTVETIGDRPSLRFAVNVARAKTLYRGADQTRRAASRSPSTSATRCGSNRAHRKAGRTTEDAGGDAHPSPLTEGARS